MAVLTRVPVHMSCHMTLAPLLAPPIEDALKVSDTLLLILFDYFVSLNILYYEFLHGLRILFIYRDNRFFYYEFCICL